MTTREHPGVAWVLVVDDGDCLWVHRSETTPHVAAMLAHAAHVVGRLAVPLDPPAPEAAPDA